METDERNSNNLKERYGYNKFSFKPDNESIAAR